jgi:hypothetical protein
LCEYYPKSPITTFDSLSFNEVLELLDAKEELIAEQNKEYTKEYGTVEEKLKEREVDDMKAQQYMLNLNQTNLKEILSKQNV